MNGLELIKHTVGGGVMTASGAPNGAVSLVKNGKIKFENATEVIVNECFSSNYDNYLIVCGGVSGTASDSFQMKLRAGTNSSASGYAYQRLQADNNSVNGYRTSPATDWYAGNLSSTARSGIHAYLYGPFLPQPTAMRVVNVGGLNNAYIFDSAGTHSASGPSGVFDGFTLKAFHGPLTGSLTIYGFTKQSVV